MSPAAGDVLAGMKTDAAGSLDLEDIRRGPMDPLYLDVVRAQRALEVAKRGLEEADSALGREARRLLVRLEARWEGSGPDKTGRVRELVWLQDKGRLSADDVFLFLKDRLTGDAPLPGAVGRPSSRGPGRAHDPVVWEGLVDGLEARVCRSGEDCLIVYSRQVGHEGDTGWMASDDEVALHVYEAALLSLLGSRGLPK